MSSLTVCAMNPSRMCPVRSRRARTAAAERASRPEHGAGAVDEHSANRRRRDPLRVALEQSQPGQLLCLGELLAQCWLADVKPMRGAAHRALLGECHERAKDPHL